MPKSTKSSDKKGPQTIDAATGKPEDTPGKAGRRIDLSSLRDVRLEMAEVYRRMDAGQLESSDASRRVYVLRQIADVITVADVVKRIEALEDGESSRDRPSPALTQLQH
jgi:hypothetical protein